MPRRLLSWLYPCNPTLAIENQWNLDALKLNFTLVTIIDDISIDASFCEKTRRAAPFHPTPPYIYI